jgi:hypothetical protein
MLFDKLLYYSIIHKILTKLYSRLQNILCLNMFLLCRKKFRIAGKTLLVSQYKKQTQHFMYQCT